jgi:DNA-binding transcriptional LysR family regulator
MPQSEKRLSRLDLNQLVVLQMLMDQRSVTRAAKSLFVTQSAVSKSLQRMRVFFGDPLFLRSAQGLLPTPRMEELSQVINRSLEQLEDSVFAPPFNPQKVVGALHISIPEMFALRLIPDLLWILRQQAPGLMLKVSDATLNHLELLESGELDFSVDVVQKTGEMYATTQLDAYFMTGWVRHGHPLTRRRSHTFDELLSYPGVIVYQAGFQQHKSMATRIPERALRERIFSSSVLMTSQLMTGVELIQGNEGIIFAPDYLGQSAIMEKLVVSVTCPELKANKFTQTLIQHRRTVNAPLHRWIREQIVAIYRSGKKLPLAQ